MAKIMHFLSDNPEIGMITSISSFLMWFMDTSLPYLKYAGIATGLMIGVVTLYIKLIQAVKDTKELKKKKK